MGTIMRLILIPVLIACGCLAVPHTHVSTEASNRFEHWAPGMIDTINQLKSSWTAGYNSYFHGRTRDDIRKLMGVKTGNKRRPRSMSRGSEAESAVTDPGTETTTSDPIPENFDARERWPDCPMIAEIRDQGGCGSCFAVSVVSAISDRICIASKGKLKPHISTLDILECCSKCGNGCDGGYPDEVWARYVAGGIVTGGNYTEKTGCMPYPIRPCNHHISNGSYDGCTDYFGDLPDCPYACQKSYSKSYRDDKYSGKKAYDLSPVIAVIQRDIMTYGPVSASFIVYEDFLTYKSGVYRHDLGSFLGLHAVRIIGWGSENCMSYWLVANSWNGEWGDNGTFKILRGSNECGLEANVEAGLPRDA